MPARPRSPALPAEMPLSLVDVVIFTVRDESLQVLLVRRPSDAADPQPSRWALPGGFIDTARDADLESAARRKLEEKTGIALGYLEQLGSFGDDARDPRGWSVTTVYFALIPSDGVRLARGGNAEEVSWFPVDGERPDRSSLAFDHGRILSAALTRLRSKVEYTALPVHLLGPEFTLPQLQRTFEIVLGRKLDKSAFRTRVLAAGFIERTDRQLGGGNRPAQLYRLIEGKETVFFPRPFYPKAKGD